MITANPQGRTTGCMSALCTESQAGQSTTTLELLTLRVILEPGIGSCGEWLCYVISSKLSFVMCYML